MPIRCQPWEKLILSDWYTQHSSLAPEMNVTASEFHAYLEKFHSTLEDTATQHLPPEVVQQLFHLSIRPSGIRGYVSTQFGVAYEYIPSLTGIDVGTSSKRIEDFFLNTPGRFHRLPIPKSPVIMLHDGAWNITCIRLTCTNAPFPFHLKGPKTQLILIDCHFDGLGWSRDVVGAEIYGNRLASFWSLELAVGRAKDEVLAALVEVNKAAASNISLAEYINSKKQNTVLVQGDYNPEGCERLESICQCLTALGYQPVLVRDVPEILGAGLSQKVMVLGSIARFVLTTIRLNPDISPRSKSPCRAAGSPFYCTRTVNADRS